MAIWRTARNVHRRWTELVRTADAPVVLVEGKSLYEMAGESAPQALCCQASPSTPTRKPCAGLPGVPDRYLPGLYL